MGSTKAITDVIYPIPLTVVAAAFLFPGQVKNPATGQVLAKMPLMRADETRAAVAAAHSVFPQV
jgi:acyl-CoA reductase-like NAD-dependent aldehyde dehydrogenase